MSGDRGIPPLIVAVLLIKILDYLDMLEAVTKLTVFLFLAAKPQP